MYCVISDDTVLASITIPVVLMFFPLMKQYLLVLPNTSEYCVISEQNISTTGMLILVCTASLVDTDVLFTNDAVHSSINIPVVLMFFPLMTQYLLVLTFLLHISTTVMVILLSTATLVDRTSVQQECEY
jgi:hypothetical protein